ncbi:DUF4382 domain-containing protein [Halobacterium jilantaiense]|nr:DUF4382 domain-containing protein [Halobacterium jilantaiense]
MSRIVPTLLVAALVVLAGCAGGIAGPNAGGTGDSSTDSATDSGTVQFYLSDERNAIDQFEHLNVTVTSVGFATAGAADANETTADAGSGNETELAVENESEGGLSVALVGDVTPGENATVQVTHEGESAANVSAVVEAGGRELTVETDANGTVTVPIPEALGDFEVEVETAENSTYGEASASLSVAAEADDYSDEDESEGGWVERDVDERSVDLTELQGANATALGNISVPEGDYEKVFVHVGEVNGTLKTGEEVNVKLPSQKLQLNENFTVGNGERVDFVFDITVFEAGNSGKYILKPVASESGTDVPIEDVDEERGGEAELDVSVVGNATAGENATVRVTRGGEPVENATVEYGDDATVRTDANGTATVAVPADGELELEAGYESGETEAEGELELELGESESEDNESEETEAGDGDDGDASASAEADLAVAYDGTFAANETVTLSVTDGDGEAVEDATVELDGEVVGETDEKGELAVDLPSDVSMASELTVTADGESVTVDASTVAAAN